MEQSAISTAVVVDNTKKTVKGAGKGNKSNTSEGNSNKENENINKKKSSLSRKSAKVSNPPNKRRKGQYETPPENNELGIGEYVHEDTRIATIEDHGKFAMEIANTAIYGPLQVCPETGMGRIAFLPMVQNGDLRWKVAKFFPLQNFKLISQESFGASYTEEDYELFKSQIESTVPPSIHPTHTGVSQDTTRSVQAETLGALPSHFGPGVMDLLNRKQSFNLGAEKRYQVTIRGSTAFLNHGNKGLPALVPLKDNFFLDQHCLELLNKLPRMRGTYVLSLFVTYDTNQMLNIYAPSYEMFRHYNQENARFDKC